MTDQELMHFQIKGAKWGQRRFQNEDGSLTPAGRERYLKNPNERRDGEGGKVTVAKPKKLVSKKELAKRKREKEAKLKAEAAAKKKAERTAIERKNILQDPNKLMANLHNSKYNYTRKEVEDALAMFRVEDDLLSLAKKRRPTEKTVSKGEAFARKAVSLLSVGVDGYEKYIQLQNLINYGSKQPPGSKKKKN